MITYHIIKDQKEIATTANVRTAKNKARAQSAEAIVALQLTWTSEGYNVKLTLAYIYSKSIGVYCTYTCSDLLKLHRRHIDLLSTRFMELLEKQSQEV